MKKIYLHLSVVKRLLLKCEIWVQFLAWRLAIKRDSVKTPQCVVDRWTKRGSLTRKSKGPFAVSWPKQLSEYKGITKIKDHRRMGIEGWFQRSGSSSFEFLLAEGDSVKRSGSNFLQSTFCFQLSTVFQFFILLSHSIKAKFLAFFASLPYQLLYKLYPVHP